MRTAAELDATVTQNMMRYYAICEHDGWSGVFTTQQSPMATIKNGARIVKIANEPGDTHPAGRPEPCSAQSARPISASATSSSSTIRRDRLLSSTRARSPQYRRHDNGVFVVFS